MIAMVATIGVGDAFFKGRDFAAWLGLVPKQISTGDRAILGKISKRGNRYLPVPFVQAAWVVLIKPKSWVRHGLRLWIEAAKKRLHGNVLAPLANKLVGCAAQSLTALMPRCCFGHFSLCSEASPACARRNMTSATHRRERSPT
jgi:transposase